MIGYCNANSCAHVQGGWPLDLARCVPVDNYIQVWRLVAEFAMHEHSASPVCQPHSRWLSPPGQVWFKHLSLAISLSFLIAIFYTIIVYCY